MTSCSAFLPMFHSFGLTLATTLPLLLGLRVVHYPRSHRPRATLASEPQVSANLSAGDADAAEPSVRRRFERGFRIVSFLYSRCGEGPGLALPTCPRDFTEVNVPRRVWDYRMFAVGDGQPLRGDQTWLHWTTAQECGAADRRPRLVSPLPQGETGMLLVHGPSVFGGYLHYDGPSPFVEVVGKSWYKTGDLVTLDEEGYYHFRGRLRRFLKVGGEMVSLPAMEEPFVARYPTDESGPRVAIEGTDDDGQRRIVLFTTFDMTLHEASAILTEAGFHGVMRLNAVEKVDEIPLLGTGKIDYKVLRKLV